MLSIYKMVIVKKVWECDHCGKLVSQLPKIHTHLARSNTSNCHGKYVLKEYISKEQLLQVLEKELYFQESRPFLYEDSIFMLKNIIKKLNETPDLSVDQVRLRKHP